RAPVSGVGYGMRGFAERSVVRAADPLLYLVPQDRPLVIAAKIALTDIDQISPQQEVALRFSAFDQRETPELFGRVSLISPDAFQDETTGQSFYRAEIVLAEGEIGRLPDGFVLIPGMPVDAFIRTARRSPIAYLTKPLADYFARAFRES
ncbi:MAG: HlyD family secretion protein, partial [Octadecabacter sp.]